MKPLIWFKRWDDGTQQWLCRIPGAQGFGIGRSPNGAYLNWKEIYE